MCIPYEKKVKEEAVEEVVYLQEKKIIGTNTYLKETMPETQYHTNLV